MTDTKPADGPETGERVPPDPIYQKSYSVHIALASVAMVGAIALAIADEAFWRRPYKGYQAQYKEAMLAFLGKVKDDGTRTGLLDERSKFEAALRSLGEYQKLDAAVAQAQRETAAQRIAAQNRFDEVNAHAAALIEALKFKNSEISALIYDAGHATHGAMEAGGPGAPTDPAKSPAAKDALERIARIRAETLDPFTWTKVTRTLTESQDADGNPVQGESVTTEVQTVKDQTVGDLIAEAARLQDEKARAQRALGEAMAPVGEASRARSEWLARNVGSLASFLRTSEDGVRDRIGAKAAEVGVKRYLDEYTAPVPAAVVASVRAKIDAIPTDPFFGGDIQGRQIHIPKSNNWVDRCEVCHLGARSDVPVAEEQLRDAVRAAGWSESRIAETKFSLFASHPRAKELFGDHDPESIGCSTCHNGNGIAITSEEVAHGQNHHWLWPIFPEGNYEAGCIQCHRQDAHLGTGPEITRARETFTQKGCWGCHPYEGYDRQGAEITAAEGRIRDMERDQEAKQQRRKSLKALAASMPDGDAAAAQFAAQDAEDKRLVQEVSQLQTEIDVERARVAGLWNEREKVGPSLKEVRIGMRPEILTQWIQDPTSIRPRSKMPVFRWHGGKDEGGLDEDAKSVANFIWWSGLDPQKFPELKLSAPQGGSAGRGKQLFMDQTLGCLACHGVEKDGVLVGSDFAADLSNVGDKKTYEWIYRWIKSPRHRLVPYSPRLGRDLTAAEAAAEDPATLVTTMPTRMPDFRLSDDDARDIATYLAGLRTPGKSWPEPVWLKQDDARFEAGKLLVRNSGCAGCHEIAGLESERGIGTDLTKEGTKSLERLDFGHHTIAAKRGHEVLPDWESADGVKVFAPKDGDHGGHGWYRPRGYFMHKLAKPDLFDDAKYFPDKTLRARMPKFRLTAQELTDLTTFLLGSVESRLPESATYRPDERGKAIRDGWWIVKRYNCEGCHEIVPGQKPTFQTLPWWPADVIHDKSFPPSLVGAGYRLRPDFLADFLRDPALGGGTARPRSVRRHLDVRMPSFRLTDDEIAKLVRFFEALAGQPAVYQHKAPGPVSAKEDAAAVAIWKAMNCLQCHTVGDTPITADTKAPDFLYAKRRLRPEWMARWIPDPKLMQPRTTMTTNFKRERTIDRDLDRDGSRPDPDPSSRWVYIEDKPEFQGVTSDHVDLMIRWLYRLEAAPK